MCNIGYKLALDGKHCLYEGDCDARAHGCQQACKFNEDGYQCFCRSGFLMKKTLENECQGMVTKLFLILFFFFFFFSMWLVYYYLLYKINLKKLDMDECTMGIHGCSDICINTIGSYLCQCHDDLTLSDDGMTCGKHNGEFKFSFSNITF